MATQDSRQGSSGQAGPDTGGHSLGPGSVVGGTWIIERLLGKGGMGAVWLARHQRLQNKRTAIKVLLGTGLRDEAYVRFAREAEIATRIGHPNIVDVLDLAALESGEPYIVLEYLQGEVLRDRLRRKGSLSWDEVVSITRQIGSALLAAHRHEVVHRDLKPENVFLVPTDSGGTIRDHVKVLDFGISKLRGSQTLQTQEAVLLGTPQYMAPEQASGRNHEVDARSDQFALGVMVYEMLTGTPPWVADTPLGLLFQVVHAPTPSLPTSLVQVPQTAVHAIEKALAKQASERFADVGAFVEALTGQPLQFLDGSSGHHDDSGGRHVVITSSGTTRREDEVAATFDGTEAVTAE
ncbi:MAG: serine/threonine protein kinase, partial [Deltaproteobacteria bacterium]|nr:serine/threonine protein kinase [Deltaproteobacteria bacterium]